MSAIGFPGRFLCCVFLVSLPAANAQAGLLDFFSPAAPEPPHVTIEQPEPTALPPLMAPLPPRPVELHRHISIVRRDPAEKSLALTGKSADLQKDATLREGDAVMTQNGIRIFAGASQSRHRANEFARLDEAKGLTKTEQTALAAIDAHNGTDTKAANTDELVTGRSSAANTPLAWKWLRDPKGRLVRYVGP